MKYVFQIFISPLLRMGGFVKNDRAYDRALVDKPGKLGEHFSLRFSDHLNSNHHNVQ